MEIILVRHTSPEIAKGICYGQTDIDVAASFEEEIKPILQAIPINDDSISYYSSPLQRCVKLAKKLSNTIKYDNRLQELNFGEWELQAWDQIDPKVLDPWMKDFVNIAPVKGESYAALHKRTTAFINDLYKTNTEKAVLVTHGGVIRSIWSYFKNIPLEKSFDTTVNYGQIISIKTNS